MQKALRCFATYVMPTDASMLYAEPSVILKNSPVLSCSKLISGPPINNASVDRVNSKQAYISAGAPRNSIAVYGIAEKVPYGNNQSL
jgi:hypothetical protein